MVQTSIPRRSLVMVADISSDIRHVGDEAMLAANLEAVHRHCPAIDVTVVGRPRGPGYDDGVAAMAGADGLFISGGGNLCSSWPELLHQRIVLVEEANRQGTTVVFGGQTLGPLTAAERALMAEVLFGVQQLGVREVPSAAVALALGVPADRIVLQVDDAFFLAGVRPAAGSLLPPESAPFLGITLDPSFAGRQGRETLPSLAAQLATIAVETGLGLVFLPHVGGPARDADSEVGKALGHLLHHGGVDCLLLPVMSPAETVWVTQRAALIVSSRYHPLVFGTAAAVPCLGVYRDSYTRIKLQGALDHVGMTQWSLSATAAEEGGLVAALRRLWSEREPVRAAMTQARPEIELREERRWRAVVACLDAGRPPIDTPVTTCLGWPADRLALAALGALDRERQAADSEASRLLTSLGGSLTVPTRAGRRVRRRLWKAGRC